MNNKINQIVSALIDYVFAVVMGGAVWLTISKAYSLNLSILKFSLIYGPVCFLVINLIVSFNKIYYTFGMLVTNYKYVEKEHMRNLIFWTYIIQTAFMIAMSSAITNFAIIPFATLMLGSIVGLNYKDKQALIWNLFTDLTDFEKIIK